LKAQRQRLRRLPSPLAQIVASQFVGSTKAQNLFFSFLSHSAYNAAFAHKAVIAARDARLPWDLRCAAILMLEHHALLLWEQERFASESQSLLASLGLLSGSVIHKNVLDEGFSTTDPAAFVTELRNRLARLDYIHAGIDGLETKPEKLLDFIFVSRRPCKLSLARYLLDPAEVAGQILNEVRTSTGVPRHLRSLDYHGNPLQEPAAPRLSEFDRQLASQLRDDHRVLWVADQTSSELNALVEYPLGTVALVIKPPGSDMEFEAKRAGMRGRHLLNIVYERNGKPAPIPHRLQGACYGHMVDYECYASDRFSEIYRRVHGVEPLMSRCLGITAISTVPNGSGNAPLIQYFSSPHTFGPGYDTMRSEMQHSVEAFEGNDRRDNLVGPVGLTTRFIIATVPNQAWLAGTTSFRLDRTADLLSARGAEIYFVEGLGRKFTADFSVADFLMDDARRLADEVLEEVLGIYHPPHCGAVTYREYIEAALALPANRATADKTYLHCMADIGLYWGTLLAVGGYTEGESFVSRNVGLKSRWQSGQWRTRICFMDHDCLTGLGVPGEEPNAAWSIEGMRKDSDWICEGGNARSEFACLREIYGVSSTIQAQGEELFRVQVAAAHTATRNAMQNSGPVQELFDRDYVDSLIVRDELIHSYLCNRGSEEGLERWKTEVKARLASTLYAQESLDYFFNTVARTSYRLERYAFLYTPR
jgi:hypothetical protein